MRPRGKPDSESAIRVANPEIMSASGLYHGMALLARRQAIDHARNVLPLAWEVRSATPGTFGGRSDLRSDALRGYALLRSLLANPEPDETLEQCIQREYMVTHPHAEPLCNGSLLEVLEADLQQQEPSSGLPSEILQKLLPRWRRSFRKAVERREVLVHIPELEKQVQLLSALAGGGRTVVKVSQTNALSIPLHDVDETEAVEGIRLDSIMADLVATGVIDIVEKTARLDHGTGLMSVTEWCNDLLEIARSKGPWPGMFRRMSEQFEKVAQANLRSVGELWGTCHGIQGDNNRFLLYILMRVRLWMTKTDPDGRDPVDRGDRVAPTLSGIYGINANEQTYRRPARSNRILRTTPGDLRSALREALESGSGLLVRSGIWDGWLADELRKYLLVPREKAGLGLDDVTVRKRAPGLER